MTDATPSAGVAAGSAAGRGVLLATVLGSGLALLDGTVVNVALKSIGDDLDASLTDLQWVSNGYLLALASLILVGGSLGDRLGRRRVYVVGVVWFAAASLACGLAPTAPALIGARVLQGIGAALLTPGSLAIIQAVFRPEDRGRAIGTWSGVASIATAIGPFVGGWLLQVASWRWLFFINLPLAVVTVWASLRYIPETRDAQSSGRFDLVGAALASVSLGGVTYALVEAGARPGWATASGVVGVVAGVGFVMAARRPRPGVPPMVPLALFSSRQFSAANAMTLLVYAALGAMVFFLVLQLQTVVGYSPLLAGIASLPITVAMFFLAAKGGELGARIGPRLPMTLGPIICGVGTFLLAYVDADSSYWAHMLPGLSLFGIGLAFLVAPLTATVLGAAPDHRAGIASGINNAVARAGSLLAVAALPALVGLGGQDYADPVAFSAGYRTAMLICAAMLVAGGVMSWFTISNATQVRTTAS